eukprot:3781013-Amphidinium_carterae.1
MAQLTQPPQVAQEAPSHAPLLTAAQAGSPWTDLAPTQAYPEEVPTEIAPMATDTPGMLQETTPQGEVITFRPYQDLAPPQDNQVLISHRLPWSISDTHARNLQWCPVSGHRNL